MPLPAPSIDTRTYRQLLDEAIARIPVHTPEWTNFNESDPGLTLIEVFAFMTEALLYRTNQMPEANHRKFLSLLGLPLRSATAAQGLVAFTNERGPRETITLPTSVEVRAGNIPFRTTSAIDVLPVEAQIYYKGTAPSPVGQLADYYNQLYASYLGGNPADTTGPAPVFYETLPFSARGQAGINLGTDTVDRSLWIALMVRVADKPTENTEAAWADLRDKVRDKIANKTLSIGIAPVLDAPTLRLAPVGQASIQQASALQFLIPKLPPQGMLPDDPNARRAEYKPLPVVAPVDVLSQPGVVAVTLPSAGDLQLWGNLDPLEAGVGDFPPALSDPDKAARTLTWLRISSAAVGGAKLLWVGVNTSPVTQRAHVANERLPAGTSEPGQAAQLSRWPVLAGTVQVRVQAVGGSFEPWQLIDDLMAAGPEVPTSDPLQPPGSLPPVARKVKVFTCNDEAGQLRFGDGAYGERPKRGAIILADYDYSQGREGNVPAGAIGSGPGLPPGIIATNSVRTWGGADAETVAEGEQQIARYLQHRDRLVTVSDFETVACRTPGVEIARVEAIPAFHPDLVPNEPGDAPGVVTLMVIPRTDPSQPDAPMPDQLFLDTIGSYICPRRLVTTEVLLRPPRYVPVWVSLGFDIVGGYDVPTVREAIKAAVAQFLSPLPATLGCAPDSAEALLTGPTPDNNGRGWPLRKAVVAQELLAVATRVPGVKYVNGALLASGTGPTVQQVGMSGLELPRLAGISVTLGDPLALDQLRGGALGGGQGGNPSTLSLPVAITPGECR